jgi:hypothetical protein
MPPSHTHSSYILKISQNEQLVLWVSVTHWKLSYGMSQIASKGIKHLLIYVHGILIKSELNLRDATMANPLLSNGNDMGTPSPSTQISINLKKCHLDLKQPWQKV